ncbi:MAG: hypothetical protein IIW86_06865 [Clostridia bacterium]|nr:hypothetical protein [Clostridia bacterium]
MDNLDFALFDSYIKNGRQETGVFARFYNKFVKTGAIKENGLPEYKEKLYIQIRTRNDTDAPDRVATEDDFMRFPREYAFYRNKEEKMKKGTPLNQFAFLSAPEIESCNIRGIFTVEDLASLTAEQAQDLNLTDALAAAQKFLEMAKNNAAIAQYIEENNKLKEKIATLEDEIKALKDNAQ